MNHLLPKPLTKGDTLGIIAPAGPVKNKEAIIRGQKYFESLGYNVIFSEHCFSQDRYLSASDEDRLSDLHWAFSDKEIDTIICARGGYGCLRLINKIDYDLIKNNPKNFCGYSDITVLSAMFLKRANLITFSSPMIQGDFGKEKQNEYTMEQFFKALSGEQLEINGQKTIKNGSAKGIMFGGNLSSIVSLAGCEFIPDENFIFFTEDLNEPVYKIDKMLTQLLNIDKFRQNVKGIAFGQFLDVNYPEQLEQLFCQIANELNVPTASGFLISHEDKKVTIPYGKMCTMEDNKLFI